MTDDDDRAAYITTHNGIALMSIAAATWLTIVSCVVSVHAELKCEMRINNVEQ